MVESHQDSLFDVEELDRDAAGYRGPVACNAARITYRQLDYWARTGLVKPSLREGNGSGSQRLYSFRDVLLLRVVKNLLDTGVSLPNIRAAVKFLQENGDEIASTTLISDGASVYACTEDDQVIDLMREGQGVFGIAVGRVWAEVDATLSQLPSKSLNEDRPTASVQLDELAVRRQARLAG